MGMKLPETEGEGKEKENERERERGQRGDGEQQVASGICGCQPREDSAE